MLSDVEYIGCTTYGYPVYDICGMQLVDTGCGTEKYDASIYGEIE